jgi:PTH2 family peptidyl-tRNA hydrolase
LQNNCNGSIVKTNMTSQWAKGLLVGATTASAFWIGYIMMFMKRKEILFERVKYEEEEEEEEEEEKEEEADEEDEQKEGLSAARVSPRDWGAAHAPFKMLLCVNQELFRENGKPTKMKPGKVAAQCCHAVLGAYKRAVKRSPCAVRAWECTGQTKIAVKCPTDAELMSLRESAVEKGIAQYLVRDAGRTQIAVSLVEVSAGLLEAFTPDFFFCFCSPSSQIAKPFLLLALRL